MLVAEKLAEIIKERDAGVLAWIGKELDVEPGSMLMVGDTINDLLTGRNAKEELIEIADLVTEMELVKHPFRSGIKAQVGVEF